MRFLVLFFTGLFMFACVTDPGGVTPEVNPDINGVFIVNEGAWGGNNASLSFYNPEDETLQNSIFSITNNEHLGELANSMFISDTLGFIVVNGSNKIEVISVNSWKRITSIDLPDGLSPRHFLMASEDKGYITTYGNSSVTILDLDNYSISGYLRVGANPEQMVKVGDKVYVANSGWGYGHTVSVIDIAGESVLKTVQVGDNPITLFVDSEDEVNVLCTGRYPAWGDSTDNGTNGGLYVINTSSDAVVDSFQIVGHPTRITYDGNETAYFINGSDITSYSTISNQLLNEELIHFEEGIIYGLSADPVNDVLYILNAGYFAANGELLIYTKDGEEQKRLPTGMIPGSFAYAFK